MIISNSLRSTVAGVTLFLTAFFIPMKGSAQAAKLKVVPEVQSFILASGNYTMSSNVSILVQTAHADSLMPIANQLKDELKAMFKVAATVTESSATTASAGEILLMYSAASLRNSEAYTLAIGDGIAIAGASRKGTFWGTRTLLQLIENHKNLVPKGNISDFPNYPSRGFMLDVARKFFTIDFLRHYVKLMSYYKLNEFQIHLNDNGFKGYFGNDWSKTYAAFRLQSDTYPGLTATDGFYTKDEFRELQRLGMQYGVNVIPEIDIPAHSLAFTRFKPELRAKAPYAADHIELMDSTKRPIVYDFFDKLFDEYIKGDNPVFIGPDVHIGTDEYVKEGDIRNVDNEQAKQYRLFTDRYLKYIAGLGKNPRLWGGLRWLKDSPATPVYANGTVMNAWSYDWVDPNQSLADGFKLITTCDTWLYIVPAAGYYRDFLDEQWLYNNFRPEKVNANQTLPNFQKGLQGSMFAVWNDICGNGISQQDVHYRAFPAVKVLSTKNWKVSPAVPFATYKAYADSASEGPGLNLSGRYAKDTLAAIMAKIAANPVAFDGKTKVALGGTDFGYDYDVSFEIKPDAGNASNAVVFQSSYSKVTLNTNATGKLGFCRDGYTYVFNYTPKTDWQKIRIVGDYKSVTLYADSVRIERLAAYSKNGFNFQQTLFFPLEAAGDLVNGFKGQLRNLHLENLDLAKVKSDFLASRASLSSGTYYIKLGDKFLTNTNPNGSGGNPAFQAKFTSSTTIPQQQWKVEVDAATKRYKITSVKDGRYVNELGAFGTNPYYATWNTYTLYAKDSLYAIQNGGDAGLGFWYAANSRLNKGDETYDDSNYIVKFVPVNTTFIDKLLDSAVKIFQKKNSIEVSGVEVKELSLRQVNGSVVTSAKGTPILKISPSLTGVYILEVQTTGNKVGTFKVSL